MFLHFEAVVRGTFMYAGAEVVLGRVVPVELNEYRPGGVTLSIVVLRRRSMGTHDLGLSCCLGWRVQMGNQEVGNEIACGNLSLGIIVIFLAFRYSMDHQVPAHTSVPHVIEICFDCGQLFLQGVDFV